MRAKRASKGDSRRRTLRDGREATSSGSESRSGLRLALKIAARTSIRSLGRSALIATMVALPVAGLTAIAITYDSGQATTHERINTELGKTQARLSVVNVPSPTLTQAPDQPYWWENRTTDGAFQGSATGELRNPADVVPAGTRILPISSTTATVKTVDGIARFTVQEGASWDDSFAGMYDVAEGRAPKNDREIMVTASTLPRLGVEVGGTVELQSPNGSTVTVVGILDNQTLPDSEQMLFARDGAISGTEPGERLKATLFYLPDTELDWPAVQELNREGITALSKAVLLDPPPAGQGYTMNDGSSAFLAIFSMVAVVAGFAAFEVILLAGAAFTVTARAQQRSLATIASVGGPRRLLFRILSANGIVLGALGGVLGIAVGIVGATAFMALTSNGSSTQYYGYHVPWLALVGFAAFAVLIGWLASLVPARNASRFDVVAALRGARKPPPPSRRRPAVGLAMLIAGIGITVVGGILMPILMDAGRGIAGGHPLLWVPIAMLIAGPILAQLGLVLCGPLLLRLIARVMGNGGIGARLASRDAARNPSRSVPALAAIMTTVFVAVFAMCMVSSGQQGTINNHQYRHALGQVAVPLQVVDYETFQVVQYGDEDSIRDALERTLEIDQIRTLASVPDALDFGPEGNAGRDGNTVSNEDGADELHAVPVVPAANLCPTNQRSPDYTEAMDDPRSAESKSVRGDWRCDPHYVSMSSPTGGHLLVGDADDLALVLDREPSAEATRTLANGGAVALYPHYVHDGKFSIDWWDDVRDAATSTWGYPEGAPVRTEKLDAVVELPEHPIFYGVFVSKATADRLELNYRDSVVLASTVTMPDTAALDALYQAMQALPDNANGSIYADIERGPTEFATVFMWGLLGLAGLIAIASAAVAIGLARFDGRQDDATLSALGARRLVRKNFAFWQALIIAGIGSALGAGMGLVPALALSASPDIPWAAPWLQIGLTVAVLPLVIACGSWLSSTRGAVSARRMAIA